MAFKLMAHFDWRIYFQGKNPYMEPVQDSFVAKNKERNVNGYWLSAIFINFRYRIEASISQNVVFVEFVVFKVKLMRMHGKPTKPDGY